MTEFESVHVRRHVAEDDPAVFRHAALIKSDDGASLSHLENILRLHSKAATYAAPDEASFLAVARNVVVERIVGHAYFLGGLLGIAVAPGWRGAGVGDALMRAVIEWAEGNPAVDALRLDTREDNDAALALFVKHGFVPERRARKVEQTGEWEEAGGDGIVFMVRPISRSPAAT